MALPRWPTGVLIPGRIWSYTLPSPKWFKISSNSSLLDSQVGERHSSWVRKNMFIEMGLGSRMGCQSDQQNLRDGIKMLRCHGIKHVAQTTAITRPEAVRHREPYSAPNRKSMFVKWSWGDHIIQPTLPEIITLQHGGGYPMLSRIFPPNMKFLAM